MTGTREKYRQRELWNSASCPDRQTDKRMISLTPGNSLTAKHGPGRPRNLIHQISAPGDEELLSLLKASPLNTHILLIKKWGCLDIWGSWPLRVELLWLQPRMAVPLT